MQRIQKVAVVGAGTMGSGIAQKLAQEGAEVVLLDRTEADCARGVERIRTSLAEAVERRIFDEAGAKAVLDRVAATTDVAATAACDLVIEAVFEDLGVKRELFGRLGEATAETTVLATNTSSFYVKDVADATRAPERVVGLHYFYHPAKNRLVEVVAHAGTDPEAYRRAWAYQERIGKTPIASKDAPGFVVNRFFVPWLNEAVRLLEEGVASIPTIERVAMEVFRIGMGPFELMNVTGIPIALHAATTLGRELGAFYAPSARLAAQVASKDPWPLDGADDGQGAEAVKDRLLGTVFFVAAALVEEAVATIEDTDIGARVGLRWSMGPFELMNRTGTREAARMAASAVEPHGLQLPGSLAERRTSGAPFVIHQVGLEVQGDLASITINRPDALNALNEGVIEELAERFDQATAIDEVRAIVIRGAGKAFVAGADIRWFVKRIDEKDVGRIVSFTRRGQELLSRFAEAREVVIALVDGLSLGGGTELALACDYIVATPRGSAGFPETGIGIYPGLGGTQRLPRRVGRGLARYLIHTGRVMGAEDARAVGLFDRVVEPEDAEATCRELAALGKPGGKTRAALGSPWKEIAAAFDHPVGDLLEGRVSVEDPALAKAVEKLRTQKAPIALRIADDLVGSAYVTPLAKGLEQELARLPEVFGTRDAYVGLSSLGRARPTFEGR